MREHHGTGLPQHREAEGLQLERQLLGLRPLALVGGGAIYAGAMALALIYLGEHYAVDVLAGIAVALAAWFAAEHLTEPTNARSATEEG